MDTRRVLVPSDRRFRRRFARSAAPVGREIASGTFHPARQERWKWIAHCRTDGAGANRVGRGHILVARQSLLSMVGKSPGRSVSRMLMSLMAGSSSWRFAIPARTSERVLSEPDPRCQVVKVKVSVSVSKQPVGRCGCILGAKFRRAAFRDNLVL